MKSNDEREHNSSDHMVGNKICTRHHELGRCTRLCNQDTAHVTSTKITDKQPNGGKGKPITKLPREDKNKHYLALIKKYVCVILDTYNNNTRIRIVKTRITHNGGIEVQRRRKQTNKKNKKNGQKDVWLGSLMKSEARHATTVCTCIPK